jgi:integrase
VSVGNVKGNWFCKWYEPGKKEHKEYFGHGDIAERQARTRDEEVKRSKGKIKLESGLSVTQVCQSYHLNHPAQPSTLSSDSYRLRSVILPILGDIPADSLTTQKLNEYVLSRIKEGKKTRTIDRELDILRSAFSWATRQDPPLIIRNVMTNFRFNRKDDSDVPMPPTRQEIQRILAVAPEHLFRGLVIGWYLGTRPGGEVSRIRWDDVDFDRWEVRVIGSRKGARSTREAPIKEGTFRAMMTSWHEQDLETGAQWVVHYRGNPVLSLKRSWTTAKRKAGITRRMRLYDVRHAFATYALQDGADIKALSEIMGHSRVETMMRHYHHVTPKARREAVEHIPDLVVINVLNLSERSGNS